MSMRWWIECFKSSKVSWLNLPVVLLFRAVVPFYMCWIDPSSNSSGQDSTASHVSNWGADSSLALAAMSTAYVMCHEMSRYVTIAYVKKFELPATRYWGWCIGCKRIREMFGRHRLAAWQFQFDESTWIHMNFTWISAIEDHSSRVQHCADATSFALLGFF